MVIEQSLIRDLGLRLEKGFDVIMGDVFNRDIVPKKYSKLLKRIGIVANGMCAEMARTNGEQVSLYGL